MKTSARKKWGEVFMTMPSFLWLFVFFMLPTLIIFAISFKPATFDGTVAPGWTWRTLLSLLNPNYPEIIF